MQKIIKRYVNDGKDDEELKFDDNEKLKKSMTSVSVDEFGNEITICAKDIILHPFLFSLDNFDDHNIHHNNQSMPED